jgi:hypothetical protein
MAAKSNGVVLLAHSPEPVETCEGQLRARHLLDSPALLPEHIDQWRVDARTSRTTTSLGVLIEKAVGDERNPWHATSLEAICGGRQLP